MDGAAGISGVSCPSATLCVAVDSGSFGAGNVITSTNPTGGTGAWSVTHVAEHNPFGVPGVSCASAFLCVAASGGGDVVTSTDPTGGAAAWAVTNVETSGGTLGGASCPSAALCVVAGRNGNILTSTDPSGGTAAWTATHLASSASPIGVSCPSVSFCVAVDLSGNVITSTNPTGGTGAWAATSVDAGGGGFWAVSCPSAALCVGVDGNGNVVTSTNPTGGAGAWTVTHVDTAELYGVSCPSVSLCVAVDASGRAVTSTDPTGGTAAWTVTEVAVNFNGVSCPTVSLCVAVGAGGVAVGTPAIPGGPSPITPEPAKSSQGPPPLVKILSGPPAETASQSAVFTFRGVVGGSYECSIDAGAWAPCTSGQTFRSLPPGDHLFRVRESLAGRTGPAASYHWTIALPKACVLRVARARVFASASGREVRLVIHYTAYRSAKVTVSYRLAGATLGTASANFTKAGIFRLPESLSGGEIGKVKTAKRFQVHFTIANSPQSCVRYYTKQLTIPKRVAGQTVWFQSDSTFAT